MSYILIIDDDTALCKSLEIQLKIRGHTVRWANTASDGLAAVSANTPDLIFLDLRLPDRRGSEVLRTLQDERVEAPVVMITGVQDMNATIEAMRLGAFDYIRKPFEFQDVLLTIEKAEQSRSRRMVKFPKLTEESPTDYTSEIIGADKKIIEVIKQIGLLSRSQVTVLIEGESGTGKELVARALHVAATPDRPFVAINCSAVVPTLPESELFGYEKGAFTGADSRKIGKLEYAQDGTVFFDEIADMSLDLQAKILRALQEREFERVGGLQSIPYRARTIAASNRNLQHLVKVGKFREDLYFRLAVSQIKLPPLRERRADIPLLVQHLMEKIGSQIHRTVKGIEEEAMVRLLEYDWPGNVRELENVLTRAIALARGHVLTSDDLLLSLGGDREKPPAAAEILPLEKVEREYIEKALSVTGWNISRTARMLNISPTTLRKKIKDYKLQSPKPA
jgi:two-component system response regulator AtoC